MMDELTFACSVQRRSITLLHGKRLLGRAQSRVKMRCKPERRLALALLWRRDIPSRSTCVRLRRAVVRQRRRHRFRATSGARGRRLYERRAGLLLEDGIVAQALAFAFLAITTRRVRFVALYEEDLVDVSEFDAVKSTKVADKVSLAVLGVRLEAAPSPGPKPCERARSTQLTNSKSRQRNKDRKQFHAPLSCACDMSSSPSLYVA